jgi:hypothetical protein
MIALHFTPTPKVQSRPGLLFMLGSLAHQWGKRN